ncbi:MAG: PhoD-like phosphatase N-terminal domain-containing protein, partial [Myxococcota bacterium]|nr:PhoD-like phosphatase N-terminal domain-containing protein [Myxococcota bacterium]
MNALSRLMYVTLSCSLALTACGSDGASTDTSPADAADASTLEDAVPDVPLDALDLSTTGVDAGPGDGDSALGDGVALGDAASGEDCVPGVGDGVGAYLPDGWTSPSWDGPLGPETLFSHGVASGDPLKDRVILWTRLSPPSDLQALPVEVAWEVATDETFVDLVAAGWTQADASRDWTVKVDALGLAPGTIYRYRFHALGLTSPVGRTVTAPSGCVARLRLAVASCGDYAQGYYLGYRELAAREDLDAIIFLGDYIYEHGYHVVRQAQPPWEIKTLDDYRARYAFYRSDPDLQA